MQEITWLFTLNNRLTLLKIMMHRSSSFAEQSLLMVNAMNCLSVLSDEKLLTLCRRKRNYAAMPRRPPVGRWRRASTEFRCYLRSRISFLCLTKCTQQFSLSIILIFGFTGGTGTLGYTKCRENFLPRPVHSTIILHSTAILSW